MRTPTHRPANGASNQHQHLQQYQQQYPHQHQYPHLHPHPPQTGGNQGVARLPAGCDGKTESARGSGKAGITTDRPPPGATAPGPQTVLVAVADAGLDRDGKETVVIDGLVAGKLFGIDLVSAVLHSALPTGQRMVAIVLADAVNQEHPGRGCWLGHTEIARRAGMTDRTVRRHVAALERRGLISVERRIGTSSVYRLEAGHFIPPNSDARADIVSYPPVKLSYPPGQLVRLPRNQK